MNLEAISLDQLRVVLTVVETRSFSAAARRLHRAQSAVSYAVAGLEEQLGVLLFDRSGYRPLLTAAGASMIDDFRAILARSDDLVARARAVARGLEPLITLVVDAVYPMSRVAQLLTEFRAEFPSVDIRLHVETLGMVLERTLQTEAAIGIIATMTDLPNSLSRYSLPTVKMVAVASPSHPIADMQDITASAVSEHIQIVLADRSERTAGRDYAVLSPRTWRVSDLSAKHALLLHGLGWGSMPAHMVNADLAEGRLTALAIPGLPRDDFLSPQAFHEAGRQPGPASRWMLDRLQRETT